MGVLASAPVPLSLLPEVLLGEVCRGGEGVAKVSCPSGPRRLGLFFVTPTPSKLGDTEGRCDLPRVTLMVAPWQLRFAPTPGFLLPLNLSSQELLGTKQLINAAWVWGSWAVFFSCLLSALGIVRFTIYRSFGGLVGWAEQLNASSSERWALPEFRAAGIPPTPLGLSPPTSWPHKGPEEET